MMGSSNFSSEYIDECMDYLSKHGYIELHSESHFFPALFKLLRNRDTDKNLEFIDYNGTQYVFEKNKAGHVKRRIIERRHECREELAAQNALLDRVNEVISNL